MYQYNKEEWIRMKNKERDETYRKIDISAKNTLSDEKLFVQYLDIQSRFSNYSVGNTLLISLQNPSTTQFKDEENWNKIGIKKKPYAKSFTILEPTTVENNKEGKKATYYNPKKMYDISQTDGKPNDYAKTYTDKELLKAFIKDCPIEIKAVDEIADTSLGAFFNEQENVLYIRRGLESPFIFQAISTELANISLSNGENNTLKDFETYCVSYMICKKYGLDVSNYNFEALPPEIKEMNVTDFREKLSNIRDTFVDIDSRISNSLEKDVKQISKEII